MSARIFVMRAWLWEDCAYDRLHLLPNYLARDTARTNAVDGYFSVFKRGMRGTCQHCKERHRYRYCYNERVAWA